MQAIDCMSCISGCRAFLGKENKNHHTNSLAYRVTLFRDVYGWFLFQCNSVEVLKASVNSSILEKTLQPSLTSIFIHIIVTIALLSRIHAAHLQCYVATGELSRYNEITFFQPNIVSVKMYCIYYRKRQNAGMFDNKTPSHTLLL